MTDQAPVRTAATAPGGPPATGLAIQPYRLHAPPAHQVARRTAETARILQRRMVLPLLGRQLSRRAVGPAELAGPLARTFRDLGGTYLKLGQLIAGVPGLLGEEVADELRTLLDRSAPVPYRDVVDQLERATGDRLDATFAHVDPGPLGSASMAVVHRAVLRDGREVALKVLRPGIERRIACDLAIQASILPRLAERTEGSDPALVLPMLRGLRLQLCEELDLRNEARTLALVGAQLPPAGLDRITVPRPHLELTSRRVLVMELLHGVPIDDPAALEARGIDPAPLVDQLVKAFFLTALRDGFFHGDLHAGNLLALRDGRLGVLDWGIVGRFEPDSHAHIRRVVRAALGDEAAWVEVLDWSMAQVGPAIMARFPVDEEAARGLLRVVLDRVFTTPIGELDLASIFTDPVEPVDFDPFPLEGDGSAPPSVPGIDEGHFDRGMFLLGKQLLFYENYGKRYLGDRSLLDDRDFFAPLVAHRARVDG